MTGAKLFVKWLRPDFRKGYGKVRKCPVCLKALRNRNKSGICYSDLSRENTLNWNNQIIKTTDNPEYTNQ